MSAHHKFRSHSPLKTVLNRLGDTYQAYCNTYNTHTMVTHDGGSRQPLDMDTNMNRKDIDVWLSFLHNRIDILSWRQAVTWHQARLSQVWENVKLLVFIYTWSVLENICLYNII